MNSNTNDRVVEILRKLVLTGSTPAVIQWRGGGGNYTYAAMFVAGYWYLTGSTGFYGDERLTNQQFSERVLTTARDVKVATGWESV